MLNADGVATVWESNPSPHLKRKKKVRACQPLDERSVRLLFLKNSAFSTKKAVDMYRDPIYCCARRRLKGLVQRRFGQSKVSWVISSTGRPEEQPDPKKPAGLRDSAGVRNRASGDHIGSCGGASNQASGYLAVVGGGNGIKISGPVDGRKDWRNRLASPK